MNVRCARLGAIETDADVLALQEGDSLTFSTAQTADEIALPLLLHEPKYTSYEDYIEDHYANYQAGFLAICGKVRSPGDLVKDTTIGLFPVFADELGGRNLDHKCPDRSRYAARFTGAGFH